jgi:soluble lytic murein transglycosylase-like protein
MLYLQNTRNRLLAAALGLALATPLSASAQVYMFEDEKGHLHFSDNPRHKGYKQLEDSSQKAREASIRKVSRGPIATRAWDGVIAKAGRTYGIAPGLVKAIVHAESLFDLYAVSHAGAQGLMQLMPATARHLGVEDPFNPWQNIEGGTRYLGYLMGRFEGDTKLALAAYNAGESVVRRSGGIPPYRETQRYVKRVLSLAQRYDADFH